MTRISNIIAAIPESDHPKLLLDALAFQAATAALVTAANDEKPVDLNTATTPKNLGKVYAAAVAFEVGRDARVRHAATLEQIATERLGSAQQQTANQFESWFAEQFDAAAKALVDRIAKQGGVDPTIVEDGSWPFDPQYAELRDALADVTRWGQLRTDYVYRFEGGQIANVPMSIPYERHSRTAILADHATALALESAAGRYRHMGDGYWLAAAQMPGVSLRWQNTQQQAAQPSPANVTRAQAAMADQAEARAAKRSA
jgi:hypothetical protein